MGSQGGRGIQKGKWEWLGKKDSGKLVGMNEERKIER